MTGILTAQTSRVTLTTFIAPSLRPNKGGQPPFDLRAMYIVHVMDGPLSTRHGSAIHHHAVVPIQKQNSGCAF